MTFGSPEWFLLVPAFLFVGWFWKSLRLWSPLRLLLVLLAAFGLSDPKINVQEDALDLFVLLDRSDSTEDLVDKNLVEWKRLIDDAKAFTDAGAFCILMEMVPGATAAAVDAAISVPTIGIGAGNSTTGQVLVWQDMAGLRRGKMPKFVKQYADLRSSLSDIAKAYGDEVRRGEFPGPEHCF